MIIIELHRTQKPFAVIVSNEVTGKIYSILYKDRYLKCENMDRYSIRWFSDNQYLFKKVKNNNFGVIYEYKNFKKKMNMALKHNFLVRNQIIKGGFI